MRNTATLVLLACLTPVALVACASGADTNTGGLGGATTTTATNTSTGTGTGTTTTSNTWTGTGTGTNTDTGGTCPDACTSDADCANACPAVISGSNCCDTQAGVCYVATDPVCPTGTGGGGTGGSTY